MSTPNQTASDALQACAERCRRNIAGDLARCLQALCPQQATSAATSASDAGRATAGDKPT